MLRLPSVREYMDTDVQVLPESMPILEAIDFLIEHHVTSAPIVDAKGSVLGILSEKDCLALLSMGTDNARPSGKVSDYMTKEVTTIPSHMNIYFAAGIFLHNNFRRLVIVDDGKMVGAITRFDLLKAISANYKLAPVPKGSIPPT